MTKETTNQTTILFFGSTSDSVIVLEKLVNLSIVNWSICGIVTQPPRPVGRDKTITPTPVEVWGKAHNITTLSFESNTEKSWLYTDEQQVIDTLQSIHADVLISASYGQKIPTITLTNATYGGLNVHPSILPRWRGGDPVPWAILSGDHQIGVTVVTLSEKFDQGRILAQQKIPIKPSDTSIPLRTHLFDLGATLLVDLLSEYISGKIKGDPQKKNDEPQAKRLTRELGYEPWDMLVCAIALGTEADRIEQKFRALHPWPGVWTTFNNSQLTVDKLTKNKRLKILTLHTENGKLVLDQVQLEGKNPVSWQQFKKAYVPDQG